MARLFPNKPAGTISPETAKVLHGLRRIPGEDVLVWIAIPIPTAQWRPDLMVIRGNQSCHLIAVSALSQSSADTVLQGDLFADPGAMLRPDKFARVERERLMAFLQNTLARADMNYGRHSLPIRLVIAFPNVTQELLDQITRRGNPDGCEFWGRETVRAEAMFRKIELAGGADTQRPLPGDLLDALRMQFSPEVIVPECLTARVRDEEPRRELGPKHTDFLLDLDQEWLAKEDLTISEEADTAMRTQCLRLVTGVVGSGKTLILLYRAMLQAKLRPDAHLLILTHNRPLTGELRSRFHHICPETKLKWQTFYQWCHEISGSRWKIIAPWERETLIAGLAGKDTHIARLPVQFLADELDWIRDQGIFRLEDYLHTSRAGRKRPLSNEQRNAIFDLLVHYRKSLEKRGLTDWSGAALETWKLVQQGRVRLPRYDFVYIDEAQFFAPVWFRLVRRCMHPERSQLFLAADPTQGFLKRRQSWLASGMNVRGHSARLLRSYRNTREILSFAAHFYRHRLSVEDEEVNLPDREAISQLPAGEPPQFLRTDSPQGERARVANEILAAINRGARPEHFLVLHAQDSMVEPFIETLNRVALKPVARNLKALSTSTGQQVRVSSLNAATGLESPIVCLCGLDSLLEKEEALGLDETDRAEILRDNTRRVYMGMTRASRKLLITFRRRKVREALEGFIGAKSDATVQLS